MIRLAYHYKEYQNNSNEVNSVDKRTSNYVIRAIIHINSVIILYLLYLLYCSFSIQSIEM